MLYIEETYINATHNTHIWETDVYKTYYTTRQQVFLALQQAHGRCTGTSYHDTASGAPKKIGWIFQKRRNYDDSEDSVDHFMQEVWVTVHEKPPTTTITYHYAA